MCWLSALASHHLASPHASPTLAHHLPQVVFQRPFALPDKLKGLDRILIGRISLFKANLAVFLHFPA
jgi:hypothetical protein